MEKPKTRATSNRDADSDYRNLFEGRLSGRVYQWLATLTGFGPRLYRRASQVIPLQAGMHVLDLGCGPAPLGLAIAERLQGQGRIDGLDLSARQLEYARRRAKEATVPFAFHRGSMDDLPFEDRAFDAVVTSLALHELPPPMRRATLDEVARVLKPGGTFALVDWSRPRLGLVGLMWLPLLLLKPDEDHWHNAYPDLCRARGLTLKKDVYLNSLVRCQVFEKDAEPTNA